MEKIKQNRLIRHIQGIFKQCILPEIRPEGFILCTNEKQDVYPDSVTTHHLAELCLEISPSVTNEIINSITNWFSERFNVQDPFAVTTIAETGKFTQEQKEQILNEIIIGNQKESGYIDLYAAFLDGGSIFSTLWALKIINLLDNNMNSVSSRAFEAIDNNWSDVNRNSFKGYYCELKWKYDINDENTQKACSEILKSQDNNGFWDNSPLYTSYILGNLCNGYIHNVEGLKVSIEKGLETLFELDKDLEQLPSTFLNAKETYQESAYVQLMIRSLISAIRYLKVFKRIDLKDSISNIISGCFPLVYHSLRELNVELKKMKEQYGNIQTSFEAIEKSATERILSKNSYEKNVFIMMPFRKDRDERYEKIEVLIKETLKKAGYRGWLASDITIDKQLWNNVACYLVACKYGIAIFTEEDDNIGTRQFNPNVSLELGFFLSRAKDVLLMKDSSLPKLQTDLVGFLYKDFNIDKPETTIPKIVNSWITELESKKSKEEQSA